MSWLALLRATVAVAIVASLLAAVLAERRRYRTVVRRRWTR